MVTNAINADIFLVWANVQLEDTSIQTQINHQSRLSAFLVDNKECPGVKVDKDGNYPWRGLKGSGISNVSFQNVMINIRRNNMQFQRKFILGKSFTRKPAVSYRKRHQNEKRCTQRGS